MSKHTKTPWSTDGKTTHVIGNGFIVASVQAGLNPQIQFANAERIVQCVNAMQGIENPDEYMKAMREVHDTLAITREKLEVSMKELKIISLLIMRISNNTKDIEILQDINDTLEGLKR